MTWSAAQYSLFEAERNRPIRDLLAALPPIAVHNAMDLGCGPGNSTELLAARFPGAAVAGLDSSPDMIEAARSRLPGLRFELADLESWGDPGPFDLLLANAVLQWLPDHATLLPALTGRLAPGGCLAVQMPDNLDEPVQRLMRDIALDGPWAAKLAGAARQRTAPATAEGYYAMLRVRCTQVEIWRTTYFHALAGGPGDVVDWFKGSGLRPFLEPLEQAERGAYLERYLAGVRRILPPLPGGGVLLPFPRLFLLAVR